MRWLFAVNAALLVALAVTGLVHETSARHGVVWRRLFRLTQLWLVPLAAACWAWLVTAVAALHLAHDPHAGAAGWLLLGTMLLGALPMTLDLDFTQAVRLCLIAMVVVAYAVGMVAVDRGGSPEELHRHQDDHRVEPAGRPAHPLPAHAR